MVQGQGCKVLVCIGCWERAGCGFGVGVLGLVGVREVGFGGAGMEASECWGM